MVTVYDQHILLTLSAFLLYIIVAQNFQLHTLSTLNITVN